MTGFSEKQADAYSDARPTYPEEWYAMLAAQTTYHLKAWDVGTGTGQAAVGVAQYYRDVIATDKDEVLLKRAKTHPRIRYCHTPVNMSEDELVKLVGGENSVDLVVAAQAVHYFDLPKFYSVVRRVLRKPGGVIAVWGYSDMLISPEVDDLMKRLLQSTAPYQNQSINYILGGYRTLPFPFKKTGLGSEGNPYQLRMEKPLSLKNFLGFLNGWQPLLKAKERGVNLLTEELIKEFEAAWGKAKPVKNAVYPTFMLVGKVE